MSKAKELFAEETISYQPLGITSSHGSTTGFAEMNKNRWAADPFALHTWTLAPSDVQAPDTSRATPGHSADCSEKEPSSPLDATHFWASVPFGSYWATFVPETGLPPETSSTLPDFLLAMVA